MKKKLYIKTTSDKYQLPIAVADSTNALSQMLGVNQDTVRSGICRTKKNGKGSYFVVEVDFDDGEY